MKNLFNMHRYVIIRYWIPDDVQFLSDDGFTYDLKKASIYKSKNKATFALKYVQAMSSTPDYITIYKLPSKFKYILTFIKELLKFFWESL